MSDNSINVLALNDLNASLMHETQEEENGVVNGITIDTVFDEEKKGDAACVLVLDDTIRLFEWVAYHYTVLPLSTLVIGFDPNSSNESIAEYHVMPENWKDAVGLPIIKICQ